MTEQGGQTGREPPFFGYFDWEAFREVESNLGPVEEEVIQAQLIQMMEGNDSTEDFGSTERNIAADFFRYGWICARLAVS